MGSARCRCRPSGAGCEGLSFGPSDIFDGISAIGQLLGGSAVCCGVWVAYSQLEHARTEKNRARKAELLEMLNLQIHRIEDAFREFRLQPEISPEDYLSSRSTVIQSRSRVISERQELFRKLRDSQVMVELAFSISDLKCHVTKMFDARNAILISLEGMKIVDAARKGRAEFQTDRLFTISAAFGDWSENDSFGVKLESDIEAFKRRCKELRL
jgi:hypothetical protein